MAALKGGDKLQEYMSAMLKRLGKGGTVAVGFLENATYPDGTPVATVAMAQNFGAPSRGVPPRPFFNKMISDNEAGWPKRFANALRAADFDVPLALARMGEGMKGQLREAIVETNAPPLSPVTLLLRDRFRGNPEEITFADVQQARHDIAHGVQPEASGTGAKPLVWSGNLLASVDSEVNAG